MKRKILTCAILGFLMAAAHCGGSSTTADTPPEGDTNTCTERGLTDANADGVCDEEAGGNAENEEESEEEAPECLTNADCGGTTFICGSGICRAAVVADMAGVYNITSAYSGAGCNSGNNQFPVKETVTVNAGTVTLTGTTVEAGHCTHTQLTIASLTETSGVFASGNDIEMDCLEIYDESNPDDNVSVNRFTFNATTATFALTREVIEADSGSVVTGCGVTYEKE